MNVLLALCLALFASDQPSSSKIIEHAHVDNNVFISTTEPPLKLTVDRRFKYLGKFPFDIEGIAGGYRYLWGDVENGKRLRRLFIVQAEGFYPDNSEVYRYGTPNPVTLAGHAYQHNVWIYDDAESIRQNPGKESELTRKFLERQGYVLDPDLVMSRFARAVGDSKKNEIIFFYFESLKDYTSKPPKSFPEDAAPDPEHKRILDAVDKNSMKAFRVTQTSPD